MIPSNRAFLFHSFLTFCDDAYKLIRATLPMRQTFFDHIRVLTTYMRFSSWENPMDFMMRRLEDRPRQGTSVPVCFMHSVTKD